MYQINRKTGDLKQSARLQSGYEEVNEQFYNKMKQMSLEARVLALSAIDDAEFNNLKAHNFRVGDNAEFSSNGKETSTKGGYTGINNKTGAETFKLDATTGNADFVGKVTTKDADFKNPPTSPSLKDGRTGRVVNEFDLASSTADIKSPKSTLEVGADGSTILLDVNPATSQRIGGVKIPAGGALKIDQAGNLTVDGAISPIKFTALWDASSNIPNLSDATGIPDTFYVVNVAGSQDLGSGRIDFNVGDWALCQADIGGTPKYVNVPITEAITVISANMIKNGILGKGIGMDTDQDIKTTANMQARALTVENIIITGSIIGSN
jgi:hypothetical protein